MSLFSIEESKSNGILPENCREIIKKYKAEGMFDISSITEGKQEYTTIYLLMSQGCNLKCPYCYQPKEFRDSNKVLTKEIIDDTVKFAFNYFKEEKVKFSLFGGEPLLNFEVIKYMIEKYPMFRYILTTNGLLINESKEIKDCLINNRNSLRVSCSIGSLKSKYGKNYLKESEAIFETVKRTNGDIHYVVADPDEEGIYEDIVSLFEANIPVVRISAIRHSEIVKDKYDSYIKLFNKISDYIYFLGTPRFGQTQWDVALKNNIYKNLTGKPLMEVPPTFCGCGYLYLAVNYLGDLYPCDFFANYPEFKLGDIYKGFNETAYFFKKMGDWLDGLYDECKNCFLKDIRLCPRAMCLAENYTISGNPLKPSPNHCYGNKLEYNNYEYIAKKAIATGVDKLFYANTQI